MKILLVDVLKSSLHLTEVSDKIIRKMYRHLAHFVDPLHLLYKLAQETQQPPKSVGMKSLTPYLPLIVGVPAAFGAGFVASRLAMAPAIERALARERAAMKWRGIGWGVLAFLGASLLNKLYKYGPVYWRRLERITEPVTPEEMLQLEMSRLREMQGFY